MCVFLQEGVMASGGVPRTLTHVPLWPYESHPTPHERGRHGPIFKDAGRLLHVQSGPPSLVTKPERTGLVPTSAGEFPARHRPQAVWRLSSLAVICDIELL